MEIKGNNNYLKLYFQKRCKKLIDSVVYLWNNAILTDSNPSILTNISVI